MSPAGNLKRAFPQTRTSKVTYSGSGYASEQRADLGIGRVGGGRAISG